MQIEYKTEKGTVLFVKVPDDLISFKLIEDMGDDVLEIKSEVKGYNSLTQRWKNIRVSSGFKIIGLTTEITEEHAKMIVDTCNELEFNGVAYNDYQTTSIHDTALDSFKSLMQHLQIYDVNPLGEFPTLPNFKRLPISMVERKQDRWKEAQQRTGRWIVLFKPNE